MTAHDQFADDLALYALNVLEGEDRAALEMHLTTCHDCRRELEQLRGDTALLALSTTGPKPPARSRKRLLEAIAKEPARTQGTGGPARLWLWGWLGWGLAAASLIAAAMLWNLNSALRQTLAAVTTQNSQTARDLEDLRRIVTPIFSPQTQRITLVSVKTPPQPQGKAFYLRNRGSLVFIANNLPPLPPQKAYELWLIPTQGAPIPAGVFKPDAHGSATVVNPPLPANTEAKAFAITVESESGASAPTMPIVMMGTGE